MDLRFFCYKNDHWKSSGCTSITLRIFRLKVPQAFPSMELNGKNENKYEHQHNLWKSTGYHLMPIKAEAEKKKDSLRRRER